MHIDLEVFLRRMPLCHCVEPKLWIDVYLSLAGDAFALAGMLFPGLRLCLQGSHSSAGDPPEKFQNPPKVSFRSLDLAISDPFQALASENLSGQQAYVAVLISIPHERFLPHRAQHLMRISLVSASRSVDH